VKECGGYLVGDRLVYQSQHLEEGEAERAPAAVEHPSARGQTRGSAGQQSRGGPRQPGMQGSHSRRGKLARKAFVSPHHGNRGKGKGQFPFFCATSVSVTVT
jgi:hypothetical protein